MSLRRLLYPRSLAIVGASDKVGPGFNAWNALRAVGFEGDVHLVNPKRDSLFGQPCYGALADIPGEIDAAFVAVQAEHVLEIARQAADKGAGGLAILSSGFGEVGTDGAKAQRSLAALAAERGLAVCGPNCLGLLNFSGRTALFGTSLPDQVPRGGVAAVVQSGSVGIALLNSARGIGFSHLITSGNEAVTTAADYIELLADDPAVQVIVVFLEQMRQPRKFVDCVRRARAAGKPVVVLKSGRSAGGQAAVTAHTGAVAGAVEVCDAALRQSGAIQVFSLDSLIETALVFTTLARPLKAKGAAMLSLSGGEIALALDAGEQAGLTLPPVSTARQALTDLLPAFSHIANPLDLTWAGLYDPTVAQRCARALGEQPDTGLLILLQDAPSGLGPQQASRYATLLSAVADGAAEAAVPLVTLSNISGDLHPSYADMAANKAVLCLRGTQEGIAALAQRLAWDRQALDDTAPAASPETARAAARAALDRMPAGVQVLDEHHGRRILASYGLPGIDEILADTAQEAAGAAQRIGFPVVLKALVAETTHKSELGLVRLMLQSVEEVHEAAAALLERARAVAPVTTPRLLVQEMVTPVAELLVGARIDPEFGPVIVTGGGGVQVELFKDVAIRLAPVTPETAAAMIGETRSGRLLDGWRGRPRGDIAAAAAAVSALSRFLHDFADEVREIEINPLAVLEEGRGCRALDCVLLRSDPSIGRR